MIVLYDYQEQAIERLEGKSLALLVMATGLGKTIVVATLIKKQEIKMRHRVLILCHNNDILRQDLGEFRKVLGPKPSLRTFFGEEKDWDADKADVLFASFQTFRTHKGVFFENEFDFVVVDEGHHSQAVTFKKVIKYFRPKKMLGITATPERGDERDIREIFGSEVIEYPLEEGIAKGWLTPVEYHIITDNLNTSALKRLVRETVGEKRRVSIKQLNETIFVRARDEAVSEIIQGFAKGKKAIIFCESIAHADNFQRFLPNSKAFHTKSGKNKEVLQSFREGKIQYILAVNKLNEGVDIPDTEIVVFLRCTDSKTIFLQQLGRGLRKIPGKEKVTVLDFVANCERLVAVKEMVEKIKKITGENGDLYKDPLHVLGDTFDFLFTDEQLDILNLIRRINEPFYPTWQEASEAAIKLKVKKQTDYYKRYKVNPKLPSQPNRIYKDFPGWKVFLGGEKKSFYSTWQEASEAAIRLLAKTKEDYMDKYRIDSKLSSNPNRIYKDFPGWKVFLGGEKKSFYSTWQEASEAAIRLLAKTKEDYMDKYRIDSKLSSNPNRIYKDFPGWGIFLKKNTFIRQNKELAYLTWQEASKAAVKIGISNSKQYQKNYKIDPRLVFAPNLFYKDFPGWAVFFGRYKKEPIYLTWQEASKAAIELKIKSILDYRKKYKADLKLRADPNRVYKDFPGFDIFLGKKLKEV